MVVVYLGRFKSLMKQPRNRSIIRSGIPKFHWGDLYHLLLTISWTKFLVSVSLTYLTLNFAFALAYLADINGIANAKPGSFLDAFSFSVQTMATIGYGAMYPRTLYIHILVTTEVFIGLLGVAMATGLMFARFSQPTARVLFSNVAVICPYNGVPTLMFRTANQRSNAIVEAQIRVTLLRPEVTPEGHSLRRLEDLKLVRSETPIFTLSWMVMHVIDETSPLYQATFESLKESNITLIIMLTGLDETVAQTMHARYYYYPENILWDMSFVDTLLRDKHGNSHINYSNFHDVMPLDRKFS